MSAETYINHPTFGLLFRLCLLGEDRELFTTLYAQRLFFVVSSGDRGLIFDPLSRADARLMMENRLRQLRRERQDKEYQQLQAIHRQTFQ